MELRLVTDPTRTDMEAAFALRCRVFVDEQAVPMDEELDGLDDLATHVVVFASGDQAVGTGRMILADQVAKMQRIAVDPGCRGQGIGRLVMDALERLARSQGMRIARLDAQTRVIGFYERLGYFAYGDLHLDADILHRWMDKELIEDGPIGGTT
jgi:predicted GNAT family N-acyltransferase